MPLVKRIEHALESHLGTIAAGGPPRLAQAIRHAVFPGGARIRPQLCLAVALACGDDAPQLSDGLAAALELMHCASLVHDDLPCFDNAEMRRGRPSVHKAWGERLAVLAGDALIVLAYRAVALGASGRVERLPEVLRWLDESVGPPTGIVAGQAWECEPVADLDTYQRAKTGSLFSAATAGGAAAAGADGAQWWALGDFLGLAYQVADDIRDVIADSALIGKPVGQDLLLDRPSATRELGLEGAVRHFDSLIEAAIESIPPSPGADLLRHLVMSEARRLVPSEALPGSVRSRVPQARSGSLNGRVDPVSARVPDRAAPALTAADLATPGLSTADLAAVSLPAGER
jgi:geranylgeranyl diphosphate synthase type II